MKKNNIVLFIAIFSLLLLISAGTYAYWMWQSDTNKNVVFNTAAGMEKYIVYDEGNSYFVGNFQPAATYCNGIKNTISFKIGTPENDKNSAGGDNVTMTQEEFNRLNSGVLEATMYMDVNSIGANTSASNDVYWVITSGESSACTGNLSDALNYGTFNGVQSGQTITLSSKDVSGNVIPTTITGEKQSFTVWIWINNAGSNLSLLSGETIDTNIWTQIDMVGTNE